MMYTLNIKILECNEISTPHQITKILKRIDELGSRYFFYM